MVNSLACQLPRLSDYFGSGHVLINPNAINIDTGSVVGFLNCVGPHGQLANEIVYEQLSAG